MQSPRPFHLRFRPVFSALGRKKKVFGIVNAQIKKNTGISFENFVSRASPTFFRLLFSLLPQFRSFGHFPGLKLEKLFLNFSFLLY